MASRGFIAVEIAVGAACVVGLATSGYYLISNHSEIKRATVQEENLGFVKPLGSDVRVRGEKDASWNKVLRDSNVFKNDRVFTGSSSSAKVNLKSKQTFTVEPNSLVILSDDKESLKIDLDSGSFLGELKKNAYLVILSRGKKTEIKSDGATIRLEARDNMKLNLVVLKGEASVQTSNERPAQIVKINEEAEIDQETIEVKALTIALKSPDPGSVVWDQRKPIAFSWGVSGEKKNLTLQVSTDPLFHEQIKTLEVSNLHADLALTPGFVYFWRVTSGGKIAAKSPTSSFSYYALKAPELPNDAALELKANWRGEVEVPIHFAWNDRSLSDSFEVQISKDKDFRVLEFKERSQESFIDLKGLKIAEYYWRVVSRHPTREDLVSGTSKLTLLKPHAAITPLAALPTPPPERSVAQAAPPPIPPPAKEEIKEMALTPLARPAFISDSFAFELYEQRLKPATVATGFTLIEKPNVEWTAVEGADEYLLESSFYDDFRKIDQVFHTKQTRAEINPGKPGQFFLRVSAQRKDEASVSNSSKLRVIVTPPELEEPKSEEIENSLPKISFSWRTHSLARQTEIQISDDKNFQNAEKKIVTDTQIKIDVSEPGTKFIRARSLNEQGWPISQFTKTNGIEIKALVPAEEPPQKQDDQILSEDTSTEHFYLPSRLGVLGGLGANYLAYNQAGSGEIDSGQFSKLMAPTLMFSADVGLSRRWSLHAAYEDRPGEDKTTGGSGVANARFQWKTVEGEFQYRFNLSEKSYYSLLLGVQEQSVPFLSISQSSNLELLENALTNGSFGLKYNLLSDSKFEYEIFMRYQTPLSSKSMDGFDFKVHPKTMFDGSLGMVRKFDNGLKVGVYWLGQYLNYSYDFKRSGISSNGTQSLFNSNVQFRIGYNFGFLNMILLMGFRGAAAIRRNLNPNLVIGRREFSNTENAIYSNESLSRAMRSF